MARKTRKIQDESSDDDAPEVVSHSTSKADAKRNQKARHDFEAKEKAHRKARNRERDHKLQERARVTKGGKTAQKIKGVRFTDQAMAEEDGGENGEDGGDDDDDVEARMLRAMKDAAGEAESGEGDDDDDDDDGEFVEFGQGMDLGDDMASGSDSSSTQGEDDEDPRTSLAGGGSMDPEAPTDDEEMDDGEDTTSLQAPIIHRSSRKADYLADDLFAAAFASQNSKPAPKKSAEAAQQETTKKRRRKFIAHPKDLVIGGRTIRTLPRPSDPRSQATARSVPSARARRFVDQSLAMKGKQALLKAKKKGWERRPVNVGVMKYQGAPQGFARSIR